MKARFKFLIMIAVIFIGILILGTNKVKADSKRIITEGIPTANSLDDIPDTISLDIMESEVEKVPELIMEKVVAELEKQGISAMPELVSSEDKYQVSVWFGSLDDESTTWDYIMDIYKVNIRISEGYSNSTHLINRQITIKYSNTDNYNEEDKKYVDELMEKFKKENPVIYYYYRDSEEYDFLGEVLRLINDSSISLVYDGRVACDIEWSQNGVLVFKDDVYYQGIIIESYSYSLKDNVNIGHDMIVDGLVEGVTITVETKENSDMRAEVSDLGYEKILGEYELTLKGAETLVKPIDITFNALTEYNGKNVCVLHKKKDGTNEKFEEKVVDGKVTITVDELSPFVIAVNETEDYILGDVDGNGEINAQDAVMILKHVAHNIELTEVELLAADTTKDGNIDAQDAVQILKYVAHNIAEF